MISDEERREVARRLRKLRRTAPGVTNIDHGYLWSLLWAVFGDELEELDRSDWLERMCARLADLIEPSIPVDPGEAGLTCVDAFIRAHTEKPVDRDALLALADEMYGRLDEYDVELHGGIYMANEMRKYARRIREACNVVDAG